MPKSHTEQLLRQMMYGFWIRTRQDPPRAVRWEPQEHEDGRQSFRGKGWIEVLPHGVQRAAERFHAADVEMAGPHEWLTYYPATGEPLCGWMEVPGQYCPRLRRVTDDVIQPFCPKHQAELEGSVGEENHGIDESGTGG